ncbi:MAG: hypothetical protein JO023_05700 [Chloroflexi bacterium]|nr:hypothetical protein [Chloroflexota bacterium]
MTAPSPQPSVSAAATPTAATSAQPAEATAEPASAQTVYVGNTDGEGVFLRNSPAMADQIRAYADGTALTIVGPDVDGEGMQWHHVRAPDGTEGYVPAQYTVSSPP